MPGCSPHGDLPGPSRIAAINRGARAQPHALERPLPVTLGTAFKYWLKLGFISFGGPAGQISMMHQERVEKRRWISGHRYLHTLNFCMLLPGPKAIQLTLYISGLMHGIRDAVVAGVLFFMPAFVFLSLLAGVYLTWGNVPLVQGIFYGIKPAVVAIVLFAAWRIGSRALRNEVLWGMAALAFIGIFVFNIGFPWIVLAAAILGAIGGKLMPAKFKSGGGHGASNKRYDRAVIDDDTPTPAHAKFSWAKSGMTIVAVVAIWLAAMFALRGDPPLTDMGTFFSKAAFLTIDCVCCAALCLPGQRRALRLADRHYRRSGGPNPQPGRFFAWHTFWPHGTVEAPLAGIFDWFPVIIAIASFVARWKYKADIMKVIGVCALLDLTYSLFT